MAADAMSMTIDELARRAGVTTRNVRAYQERGLLAPPAKVGRTGYYDEGHLERLEAIGRLLSDGFSLAAIRSLLEAWEQGGSLAEVLGFEQALHAPYTDVGPVEMHVDELGRRLPGEAHDGAVALARAVEAGLVVPEDDGQVVVTNPTVLEAGEVLHDVGMPVDALADELVLLRRDADAIAARFVDLFLDHVWAPFEADGAPVDDLPRITEALDRTRPVPSAAAGAMVAQAMRRRMDDVAERLLAIARRADGDAAGDVDPRADGDGSRDGAG